MNSKNRLATYIAAGMITVASLIAFGITSGCKTSKLEPGGAYTYAVTNSSGVVSTNANWALFAADTSFRMAYTIADSACKIEHDNREMLWKLDPQIKLTLDKIRPKIIIARDGYIKARDDYLKNPSNRTLSAVNDWVARMQSSATEANKTIQIK